jgi:Contractile injection system tape measure protein
MAHVINTLEFEAICPDEARSFSIRKNFAQTFQSQIAEIIDEVCSANVGDNESLRIDKLELDLGSFSLHSLDTEFKTVFRHKFEDELKKHLSKLLPAQQEISRQLSDTELFFYFLINGTLPWWAEKPLINLDQICSDICNNHVNTLINFFYRNRSKINLWQRVLWQLSSESKKLVIESLIELKAIEELFTTWVNSITERIHEIGSKKLQADFKNITDTIIKNAQTIFSSYGDTGILKEIFKSHIEEVFKKHKVLARSVNIEFTNIVGGIEDISTLKRAPSNKTNENLDGLFNPDIENPYADEKLAVKNAGIVLPAPFLKPFFKELNLLKEDTWKSREAAFKGVHLLKFLSNGQTKTPEYSLVLEKILCGVSIDMPVPFDMVLEDKEMQEAESLLKAVIEHWKILKNTSIDGLRDAFLKRDGLLTKKEDGWLLQVEQKTLDVLLDKIPWGYSTISLPWNSYLVFVEW